MELEGDTIVWDVLVERFLHFLQSTGYVIDARTIDAIMDTISEERGIRYEGLKSSVFTKPKPQDFDPDIDFVYE
jgi:hypothetical protein